MAFFSSCNQDTFWRYTSYDGNVTGHTRGNKWNIWANRGLAFPIYSMIVYPALLSEVWSLVRCFTSIMNFIIIFSLRNLWQPWTAFIQLIFRGFQFIIEPYYMYLKQQLTSQSSILTYCLTASPTFEGSAMAKAWMISTSAVTVDSTCWKPNISIICNGKRKF